MDRRSLLKGVALVGSGGLGYAAYANGLVPDDLTSSIDDMLSPPPTENQIGSAQISGSDPFNRIIFYESGAAEVYFKVGHDTDRFGITHASLDILEDPFRVWKSPTYEGPKVINLQAVIENNAPYPGNAFTIGHYYDPTKTIDFDISESDFRAPWQWYPLTVERN